MTNDHDDTLQATRRRFLIDTAALAGAAGIWPAACDRTRVRHAGFDARCDPQGGRRGAGHKRAG